MKGHLALRNEGEYSLTSAPKYPSGTAPRSQVVRVWDGLVWRKGEKGRGSRGEGVIQAIAAAHWPLTPPAGGSTTTTNPGELKILLTSNLTFRIEWIPFCWNVPALKFKIVVNCWWIASLSLRLPFDQQCRDSKNCRRCFYVFTFNNTIRILPYV